MYRYLKSRNSVWKVLTWSLSLFPILLCHRPWKWAPRLCGCRSCCWALLLPSVELITQERLPEQVIDHTLDAPASPPAIPSAEKWKKGRHKKWIVHNIRDGTAGSPERETSTGQTKFNDSRTRECSIQMLKYIIHMCTKSGLRQALTRECCPIIRKASPSSGHFAEARFLWCRREGGCCRCHREAELHRFGLRHRAQIDYENWYDEDLCLPDRYIISVGAELSARSRQRRVGDCLMIFFMLTPNISVVAGNVVPASRLSTKRRCTPMVGGQSVRPCPNGFLNAWRWNDGIGSFFTRISSGLFNLGESTRYCCLSQCSNGFLRAWRRNRWCWPHPRWRSRWLLHQRECTRSGFLQLMWILKGRYGFSGPSIVHSSVCLWAYNLYGDWSLRFTRLRDELSNSCFVRYGLEDPCRLPSAHPPDNVLNFPRDYTDIVSHHCLKKQTNHESNLRFLKNHLWNSVKQLFDEIGKLIRGRTEITGINTIDSEELTRMSTSLLHSRAYQYKNAEAYVFSDSVLCVAIMGDGPIATWKSKWNGIQIKSFQGCESNRRHADGVRVENIHRNHNVGLPLEDSKFWWESYSVNLSTSKDRNMLMSMYNNIEWDTKGNPERCEHYPQTVANYARKFLAFIGRSWGVDQKRNGKELSLADQTDLGKTCRTNDDELLRVWSPNISCDKLAMWPNSSDLECQDLRLRRLSALSGR